MYLSVVVPAYNEERNIEKTLRSIADYVQLKKIDAEIILVVDGAKDRTAEIGINLAKTIPILKVVDRKENRGKGYTVREGLSLAQGSFCLFTDADNSTTIDHIERMMPYFDQGFDVVIGSIAARGHTVAAGSEPAWRRILGKLGNLFIQLMVVPGIFDTQRGFKIMRASVVKTVVPRMTIDRWGFDIELLGLARKFGFKIKEVPVDWHNDPNSHVGASAYKEVLFETIKIRWNLISGKYE